MSIPKILLTTGFVILICGSSFAEEAQVNIQKLEDRTEATVSSKTPSKTTVNVKWFNKPFIWTEELLVGVARTTSASVGFVVDSTVKGTEMVSEFVFSWFFNSLDYRKLGRKQAQS